MGQQQNFQFYHDIFNFLLVDIQKRQLHVDQVSGDTDNSLWSVRFACIFYVPQPI
jgi:hypothetical protein